MRIDVQRRLTRLAVATASLCAAGKVAAATTLTVALLDMTALSDLDTGVWDMTAMWRGNGDDVGAP